MAPWVPGTLTGAIELSATIYFSGPSYSYSSPPATVFEPRIRSKNAVPRTSLSTAKSGKTFAASVTGVEWQRFKSVSGDAGGLAPQCRLRFGSERKSDRVRASKVFRRRGGYRPPERA